MRIEVRVRVRVRVRKNSFSMFFGYILEGRKLDTKILKE
jgi:hypothetical protein